MANFPEHPNFDFELPEFEYTIIDSPGGVSEVIATLDQHPELSFDFESTGVHYMTNEPAGVSFGTADHAWYFHGPQVLEEIAPWMQTKMGDPNTKILGHNAKFDMHLARKLGTTVANPIDTMIAQWLVNENFSLKLKDLARLRLGVTEKLASFSDLQMYTKKLVDKSRKNDVEIWEIPLDILGPYAALDARLTWDLWKKLERDLQDENQWDNFFNVQMPFITVLMDMERNGARVDLGFIGELMDEYSTVKDELMEEWNTRTEQIVGDPVNPNSPAQLRELLYTSLKLPKTGRKTGTGLPSTDRLTLMRLKEKDKSGLVKLLLEYRNYDKLVSTYLSNMVDRSIDGRIHTNFNQTGTVTGRLSSSGDLNLQNIPIRTELGRKIREAFVAEVGHMFLGIDYSQIELRLLAHFSRDSHLVKAYLWGQDIHQLTADRMGLPRYIGKTVNFGTVYGQGPRTLADVIEESGKPRPKMSQAKRWLAQYDQLYPGVPRWKKAEIIRARDRGYVETIAGRRRRADGLDHWDNYTRFRAERMSINAIIQGSAGDVINQAMLWVAEELPNYNAKMILQVHDELAIQVPNEAAKEFAYVVQDKMESVKDFFEISVPIVAEPALGPNWMEAH